MNCSFSGKKKITSYICIWDTSARLVSVIKMRRGPLYWSSRQKHNHAQTTFRASTSMPASHSVAFLLASSTRAHFWVCTNPGSSFAHVELPLYCPLSILQCTFAGRELEFCIACRVTLSKDMRHRIWKWLSWAGSGSCFVPPHLVRMLWDSDSILRIIF